MPVHANDEEKEEFIKYQQKSFFYFYYPNKENLVNSALLFCLQPEKSQHVNRAAFDFLISHMPINGDINSQEEKIRLFEQGMMTLTK